MLPTPATLWPGKGETEDMEGCKGKQTRNTQLEAWGPGLADNYKSSWVGSVVQTTEDRTDELEDRTKQSI